MFGFNTFNRCDSIETLVSQLAHTASKYWAKLALGNGNMTSIEQDPVYVASFYKDLSR